MYQHATSGAAYREVLLTLGDKQKIVLNAIQALNLSGACNDRMITERLGWKINQVTGRRNELVAAGAVYEAYKAIDPTTGRTTSFWMAVDKQLKLF